MKKLISMLILSLIMQAVNAKQTYKPYTFKCERCQAIANNTFISPDGNLFEINNNNLIPGKSYFVLFDTYNTKTRIDDDIVDFDTELYYKWIKYL